MKFGFRTEQTTTQNLMPSVGDLCGRHKRLTNSALKFVWTKSWSPTAHVKQGEYISDVFKMKISLKQANY